MQAATQTQLDAFEQQHQLRLPSALRSFYLQEQPDYPFTVFSILDAEYEVEALLPFSEGQLTVCMLAQWDREDRLLPYNTLIPIAEGTYDRLFYLDTKDENIYLRSREEGMGELVMNNTAEFLYQIRMNQSMNNEE